MRRRSQCSRDVRSDARRVQPRGRRPGAGARRWGAAGLALVAVLGVAACGGDDEPADAPRDTPSALPSGGPTAAPRQPGAEWESVDPAKVGLDPAALAEIAKTAEEGKSNCL